MPGFSYVMNCDAHIWCWPTPAHVDRVRPGDLADAARSRTAGPACRPAARRSRAGSAPAGRAAGRHHSARSARCPAWRARLRPRAISSSMTCLASPTIGTSAARFLPISAGSMSACTICALRGEAVQLAGDPVVEAGAERDQQVGLLQRVHRGDRAVHAGHAEVLRVRVRERAAGHQRGDHRDAGQLGEHAQLLGRAGLEHAAADVEHRPLGGGDQPGRLPDLLAVRVQRSAGSRAGPASAAR